MPVVNQKTEIERQLDAIGEETATIRELTEDPKIISAIDSIRDCVGWIESEEDDYKKEISSLREDLQETKDELEEKEEELEQAEESNPDVLNGDTPIDGAWTVQTMIGKMSYATSNLNDEYTMELFSTAISQLRPTELQDELKNIIAKHNLKLAA